MNGPQTSSSHVTVAFAKSTAALRFLRLSVLWVVALVLHTESCPARSVGEVHGDGGATLRGRHQTLRGADVFGAAGWKVLPSLRSRWDGVYLIGPPRRSDPPWKNWTSRPANPGPAGPDEWAYGRPSSGLITWVCRTLQGPAKHALARVYMIVYVTSRAGLEHVD